MLLIDGKLIGGRFSISWAPDHDTLDGALSEVRLWKRALAEYEVENNIPVAQRISKEEDLTPA